MHRSALLITTIIINRGIPWNLDPALLSEDIGTGARKVILILMAGIELQSAMAGDPDFMCRVQ